VMKVVCCCIFFMWVGYIVIVGNGVETKNDVSIEEYSVRKRLSV